MNPIRTGVAAALLLTIAAAAGAQDPAKRPPPPPSPGAGPAPAGGSAKLSPYVRDLLGKAWEAPRERGPGIARNLRDEWKSKRLDDPLGEYAFALVQLKHDEKSQKSADLLRKLPDQLAGHREAATCVLAGRNLSLNRAGEAAAVLESALPESGGSVGYPTAATVAFLDATVARDRKARTGDRAKVAKLVARAKEALGDGRAGDYAAVQQALQQYWKEIPARMKEFEPPRVDPYRKELAAAKKTYTRLQADAERSASRQQVLAAEAQRIAQLSAGTGRDSRLDSLRLQINELEERIVRDRQGMQQVSAKAGQLEQTIATTRAKIEFVLEHPAPPVTVDTERQRLLDGKTPAEFYQEYRPQVAEAALPPPPA